MELRSEYEEFLKQRSLQASGEVFSSPDYIEVLRKRYPAMVKGEEQKITEFIKTTPASVNKIIGLLANRAEGMLMKSGYAVDLKYFAGEFPTGEVNACAVPVSEGCLFLLNTGIVTFFRDFSKLMAYSLGVTNFDERGRAFIDEQYASEGYSFDLIAYAISKLIVECFFIQTKETAKRFEVPSNEGLAYLRVELLHWMEMFVMLHEFSHASLGHLLQNKTKSLISPAGNIEIFEKSWEQEYEADLTAVKCIIDESIDEEGKIINEVLNIRLASVMAFFCTVDIVETVISSTTGVDISKSKQTHPPAQARIVTILMAIEKGFRVNPMIKGFASVKHVLSWYSLIKQQIIVHITGDKDFKLKEPNQWELWPGW